MSSPGDTPLPRVGRLLGLDYGTKRFGVAVSNFDQTIASPVANRDRKDPAQDARFLAQQAVEYRAVGLVCGLPVHMSGDEGEKARAARAFGAWAAAACRLPVVFHDERFSTAFAEQQLLAAGLSPRQRQARRDMLAAQFVLQSFLESRRGDSAAGPLSDPLADTGLPTISESGAAVAKTGSADCAADAGSGGPASGDRQDDRAEPFDSVAADG